ncbi:MAG: NAD-dependent epimerase/dehydratase family protein [Patescibacteria group bacterium]
MKILVTGGAGFIGSHIVDALIKQQHRVVVVDNLSTGRREFINSKAKFYRLDIQDKKLGQIFKKEKPAIVFHLAAQIDLRKSVDDPVWDAKTNILGSLNVLENCRQFRVKKIIFASTGGAIYGDLPLNKLPTKENQPTWPLAPYGLNKLTVEHYLNYYQQIFGLAYTVLRYGNVYGPRQNALGEAGVVAIFINKILQRQQPIINGNGLQTRDYVYVGDVVRANLLALKSKKIGIYNVGAAKQTSVNQIFAKVSQALNVKIKEVHGPAKVGEQRRSCLSFAKISRELGWQPRVNLDQGIKLTVDWFKNN